METKRALCHTWNSLPQRQHEFAGWGRDVAKWPVVCQDGLLIFFLRLGVRGGDTEIWQSTYHISEMEDMIGSLVIVAGAWRVTKITTFHQDSARQCTCRPVTCDFPLALNLNFGGTGVTRCVQYEGKLPVFRGWRSLASFSTAALQLATNLPADTRLAWRNRKEWCFCMSWAREKSIDELMIMWLHTWHSPWPSNFIPFSLKWRTSAFWSMVFWLYFSLDASLGWEALRWTWTGRSLWVPQRLIVWHSVVSLPNQTSPGGLVDKTLAEKCVGSN